MKAIQRIPTAQYGYIELELEYETAEDAFIDHARLLKLYEGGVGLDAREWKKVRKNMLQTGEFDPNISDQLNPAQRWWVNETKLALRDCSKEEPVIEHDEVDEVLEEITRDKIQNK